MLKRTCNADALRDLIERSGVGFKTSPRSFILECPRCDKQKLYIEKKSGRSICFHCGRDFQGWADKILPEITGLTRQELAQTIYGDSAPPGTDQILSLEIVDWWNEFGDADEDILIERPLPELIYPPTFASLDEPHAKPGVDYLAKRGIPLEIAKEYNVRYDYWEQRVVFPVEENGEVKGWQARTIKDVQPKILTTGEVGGKLVMFSQRLVGSPHVVLCEGPIDAIHCHLCGGNVATMGKNVSKVQLEKLLQGKRALYVALDPDAYEQIAALARDLCASGLALYRMEPPRGVKDLGDLDLGAVYEIFRTAPRMYAGQVFAYIKNIW